MPEDSATRRERTIKIDGTDRIEYLVSILEKAYFETKESKHKRFLASLLSKLA